MFAKISRYFKSLHLPTVGVYGFAGLAVISGLIFALCGGGGWWLLGFLCFVISGCIAALSNQVGYRKK